MALSFLFIVLAIYALLTDFSFTSITIASIIIIVFTILLWFNFICIKLHKYNKGQTLILNRVKNTGKILFGFVVICILGILICTVTTYFSFLSTLPNKLQKTFFSIFLGLFMLCAFTAIANLVFFSKTIRNNKVIVNEFLNEIGQ
jgi:hypothetical protein